MHLPCLIIAQIVLYYNKLVHILNKWSVAPAIVDAVKTHHDADTDLYGKIVSYANKIDHDKNNAEDYIYQLNKDFPIKDMDILIESIQTCLSECIDGKE